MGELSLGTRLKRLRHAKGWTQQELAVQAGVNIRVIQGLEQGRTSSVLFVNLIKLAQALGCGTDEFWGLGFSGRIRRT